MIGIIVGVMGARVGTSGPSAGLGVLRVLCCMAMHGIPKATERVLGLRKGGDQSAVEPGMAETAQAFGLLDTLRKHENLPR